MMAFAGLWGLLSIACMGMIWYVWHGYSALMDQEITRSAQTIYTVVCVLLGLLFGLWTRDSLKEAKKEN